MKRVVLNETWRNVRVDSGTWEFIQKYRKEKEPIRMALKRLLGVPPKGESVKTYVILPESKIVCERLEDAKGEAILRAIKSGKKKPTEKPVLVRVVDAL